MLNVAHLSFAYGKKSPEVLKNVSFSAEEGTCVAILGPNGAGKSTLLRCMDGILRVKSGNVTVNGRDLLKMSAEERAKWVGFVPQQAEFSGMTVFDTVLSGRKPYLRWGVGKKDYEITEHVLAEFRLTALSARPVSALSGGERQRAALARALAQEPRILLLDEPTANLDLQGQLEFVRLLRGLAREQGKTVLASVHDLNLALRFADRVLLLKNGAAAFEGAPGELGPEQIRAGYGVSASCGTVDGYRVIVPVSEENC